MRVVDDDGNIIKTGDPETDAVSEPAESSLNTVPQKVFFQSDLTEPTSICARGVAKQHKVSQLSKYLEV